MMSGLPKAMLKLAEKGGIGRGPVSWYPDHMAETWKAIRRRLKFVDLILEVRDARIPLSSANENFQELLNGKRHLLVFSKSDLANSKLTNKWTEHFRAIGREVVFVNTHNRESLKLMLNEVRSHLQDIMEKKPTILIMAVGIPNVGKSALINGMHIMGHSSSSQEKLRKAIVGPFPGVTQEMTGYKIAHQPSIFVLDTPGVLVPNIHDIDIGLKLTLTGAVKDSVIGEDSLARYLLAMLNGRGGPPQWKKNPEAKPNEQANVRGKKKNSWRGPNPTPRTILEMKQMAMLEKKREMKKNRDFMTDHSKDEVVKVVREALSSSFEAFEGNIEDEDDMEKLVETQMVELRHVLKIPDELGDVGCIQLSRKLLNLYRTGRLGHYSLDIVPGEEDHIAQSIF